MDTLGYTYIADFLHDHGVNVNHINNGGESSLLNNVIEGNLRIQWLFNENSLWINKLIFSLAGQYKNVTALLDLNADVNLVYENERSVLHWAANGGLCDWFFQLKFI